VHEKPIAFLLLLSSAVYAAIGAAVNYGHPWLAVLALAGFLVAIVWMVSIAAAPPAEYPSRAAVPQTPAAPSRWDGTDASILITTISLSEHDRNRVHDLATPLEPAFVARIAQRPPADPSASA
jgi:hypothetical protein